MNRANLVLHAKAGIDRGSQSFAAASRLFKKPIRERVWLLYAWCRECDDMVDGQDHGGPMTSISNPARQVAAARAFTARAHGGENTGKPAFDAFGVVAQECSLPGKLADDVIEGFALDAKGWRPKTEDDLFQYCYHVAGAVGCLMAVVMGISPSDDDILDRACDLGIAFQLANIARDVAEDATAGRCYLPREWLDEMRIDPENILNPARREALVILVDRLCDLSEKYEASARVGTASLSFRSRWAVLAAAGIYGDVARAVRRSEGASLEQRVVTGKAVKIGWVAKAFAKAIVKPKYTDRGRLWIRNRTG